ncbi:death-associated inhibitor of apoptosis 1-like isoform X2 [Lycorma delicatula]|uniref:death-associated inhibitor of apoptosis 1-like isoform X2 n=1 Tax=Lycorma delicatula TaxID=130591 RepID=UPI003F510B22
MCTATRRSLYKEMPPSPNNTVENSPRPSRPIEERPKRLAGPLPAVQSDNISRTFQPNSIPETSNNSNMSLDNRARLHELINTTVNFNREVERLKTFEGWRVPFLSAGQMAAAGFYYTKRDDVVRCAFCGVEVGSWEEGDNPMHDHQRWSPACRFLRKLPVGNVPISSDNGTTEHLARDTGYDVCGTGQYGIVFRPDNSPNVDIPSIEKLGIQQSRPPAFPNYSTYEARMRSYEMWPISLKLKPNVLSEAGFFYTGKGDQTICYHCGGGLKDWEESDEPWEEHARWFNKCNFVLLVKGKEFVDRVANKKPEDSKSVISSENSSVPVDRTPESISGDSKASTSGLNETNGVQSAEVRNEDIDVTSNNSSSSSSDSRLCKICFQEEMGVLFLPCGHIVACPKCALSLTTCAVCRKPFSATIRAFLS